MSVPTSDRNVDSLVAVLRATAPLTAVDRSRLSRRIEEETAQLEERAAAKTVWWRPALACAGVLAAVVVWVVLRTGAAQAPPERQAQVEIFPRAQFVSFSRIGSERQLEHPRAVATIEAAVGERVRATLANRGHVELSGPGKVVVTSASDSELVLSMTEGALSLAINKQTNQRIHIDTSDMRVTVTGTVFSVQAGSVPTQVSVAEGSVRVKRRAQRTSQAVTTGQTMTGDNEPDTLGREQMEALLRHKAAEPPALRDYGTIVVKDTGGEVWVDERYAGSAPLSSHVEPGTHRIVTKQVGQEPMVSVVHVTSGSATVIRPRPEKAVETPVAVTKPRESRKPAVANVGVRSESRKRAPVRRRPKPKRDGPAALYRSAERAMAEGDRGRARELLASLSRQFPTTTLATTALYELARMAFRAGDFAQARAYATEVKSRKGSGFSEAASYLVCRSLVATQSSRKAYDCLRAFRSRFPRSHHASEALALAAAMAAHARQCVVAEKLAEEYVKTYPRGAHRAHLRYARRCRRSR